MKIFLAGLEAHAGNTVPVECLTGAFVLESFFYCDSKTEKYIPLFGDFLLDSGAFTLFSKNGNYTNWEDYIDRYANFINRNKVNKFFELDIDRLIGYDKVLELRKRLEQKTGKQCIPVWHKTRGKEEFLRMCDEYPYVAIGGLVKSGKGKLSVRSKGITDYFNWFINEAHKRKRKIHALGFTSMERLKELRFDSTDSTSWLCGNKFGFINKFTGTTIEMIHKKQGKRLKNPRDVYTHNFNEWKKFQKYMDMKY